MANKKTKTVIGAVAVGAAAAVAAGTAAYLTDEKNRKKAVKTLAKGKKHLILVRKHVEKTAKNLLKKGKKAATTAVSEVKELPQKAQETIETATKQSQPQKKFVKKAPAKKISKATSIKS